MYKQFSKRQLMALILSGSIIIQSGGPITAFADTQLSNAASVTTSANSASKASLMIGQSYHGFKLKSKVFSKDLNAEMFTFIHEKNGGQLIYIENDDANKWFSIAFKTPAVDQTGVNHIIEHTVLEGSAKYKVKSPFTEMGKRSVNTYMNALTDTDVTYYPVASESDKDFKNLMEIYMDAVFAPNVLKNPMILQQEGWRYEIDKKTGKLAYNGVVYSEMKGTLSDPYTTVYDKLASSVYPDTKYRFNSGGDPESILDLTHKHLVETYQKYYQPSNACITLYGKMDILERLNFINEQYYSKYGKGKNIVDHKAQESFDKPIENRFTYPGSEGQTAEKDSILTWSAKIDNADTKDLIGLSILAELLGDPKSSLVYKKMVKEADDDMYVNLHRDYFQPMFTFMMEGADEAQMEKFGETIQMGLENMAEKGVNKERLAAVLNQYEISCKYTLTSANKGETAIEVIAKDFARYDNPTKRLNEIDIIEQIKRDEFDSKYFENLIQKYLLDNTHIVKSTFVPDVDFMKNIQSRIDKKLTQRISKLPTKELKSIKDNITAFNKWQNKPNDQSGINQLPGLTLADIDTLQNDYKMMIQERNGGKLVKHVIDSKGLSNINLFFDMSVLSEEELKYLDLFTLVLKCSNTKSYKYLSLQNLIEQNTSGISFQDMYLDDQKQAGKCKAVYAVNTTYLKGNEEQVYKILREILTSANLKSRSQVKYRVSELVEAIQDEKMYSTPSIASTKLEESLTGAGKLQALRYTKSYEALKAADEDFDAHYDKIQSHLDSIYKKLFNQNNMLISVSSDDDGLNKIGTYPETLMASMSATKETAAEWNLTPLAQKTALIFPTEMQYVEMGFNMNQIGEKVSGKDMVFAQLISDGYMYEKIRMKGGAYGGSMNISYNGNVEFSTYRDPNLKDSVEAIKQLSTYLKTMKLTQAELDNAIIAVAGRIGHEADLLEKTYTDDLYNYINYSKADQERILQEILSTKVEDLSEFARKIEKGLISSSLVVAGSEDKINENKDMFSQIIKMSE